MKAKLRFLAPLVLALLVLLPTPAWAGGYITMGTQESPSGSGTTWQDGSGYYSTGDYIYLHASPYSGYEFDYWDIVDTDTGSTLIINPNADAVFSTYDLADVNLWAIAHFKSSSSGHNLEYHPVQYGTCTTNGTRAHYRCVDCGQLFWDSDALSPTTSDQLIIWATGHSWGGWYYPAEPTCVDSGTRYHECENCHEIESEVVPATGIHSWGSWTTITSPTCGTDGVSQRTCTVCGATDTQPVPATGSHTWDAGKQTKEPAVHVEGEWTYTCTVCGATKVEKTPGLKASYGIWTFASPSSGGTVTGGGTFVESGDCTITATPAPGYTFSHWQDGRGWWFSDEANYTFTVWEEWHLTAVFEHTHSWDGGKVTTAASYDAPGVRTYTCTICGDTWTESIPRLEYTVKLSANPEAGGTVSGAGSYTKGSSVTITATPAEGYEFVNWANSSGGAVISTDATLTFDASGDVSYIAVFEKIHVHDWKKVEAKEPTCTGKGNDAYFICSECGMMVKDTESLERLLEIPEIAALDHDWDEGKVTKEATATAEGERTFTCKRCGKTKTEPIPKNGSSGGGEPTPGPSGNGGIPMPIIAVGAVGAVALGALIGVLVGRRKDDASEHKSAHMRR